MTLDFSEHLADGQAAERAIDALLARWYTVGAAGDGDQRRGIDRWITPMPDAANPLGIGGRAAVAYTVDFRAAHTGSVALGVAGTQTRGLTLSQPGRPPPGQR